MTHNFSQIELRQLAVGNHKVPRVEIRYLHFNFSSLQVILGRTASVWNELVYYNTVCIALLC